MHGPNIFCSLCGASLGGTSAAHICTGTLSPQSLLRNPSPQYGWECPRCGCVMNPTFPTCWNCRGEKSGSLMDTPSVKKEEGNYEYSE